MSTISHPPTGAVHEPGWSAMFRGGTRVALTPLA
jgi:hypothetical protein